MILHATEEWQQYLDGAPYDPGFQWLILADDAFVADRWNVKRVVGDIVKLPINPVLIPDRPWETNFTMLSVLYDDAENTFHMWYGIQGPGGCFTEMGGREPGRRIVDPGMVVGYAASRDGIRWNKPELGLYAYNGYEETNIVVTGDRQAQEHNVWINRSTHDPDRRFLMTYCDRNESGERCIMLACSPDGIHWTVDRDASPLAVRVRDGVHQIIYDDEGERWLYYRRPPQLAWKREHAYANHQRRYGVSFNSTLSSTGWTFPRMVLIPEEEVDVPWLDNLRIIRRGSHFVCLWTAMDERVEGLEDVHIAFSRDGVSWTRLPHRPVFLPLGPAGSFDAGEARQPTAVVDQGDHMLLYYTGNRVGQKANRGMFASFGIARMRRDRWVGLRGDDPDGWVLSREMVVCGSRLELNHVSLWVPYEKRIPADSLGKKRIYERGKKGYIRVELAERDSGSEALAPISGYTLEDCNPVIGDGTSTAVKWRDSSDISSLRGRAVFVRFQLVSAELYCMRFAEESSNP